MNAHPAAEAARAAMAANRYELAAKHLDSLPESESEHPDVLTERAWMCTLKGREDTALAMLPSCVGGVRYPKLQKVLAEHYRCRFILDAKDTIARNACADLRDVPIDAVGTKLTACIIAKNEARNLPRCLESLLDIVDEIVVLDTGSCDRTVPIAIEFGAVIGEMEWTHDFSAARNAALDLATGHWVLWIDADEELTRDSFAAIRRALCRPQFGGFDLEIVNWVEERDSGAHILHYPTRLFRRIPGVRFTGAIHEQIQPSLASLGLPWARLDGARLIHHGYKPSALADGKKLERTRTMLEQAVAASPGDGFQWFNLANANLTEKRYPEAVEAAEQALRFIGKGQPWRDLTWQILAAAHYRKGDYESALFTCERCEAAGDNGLMNEYERAQVLLAIGRLDEALRACDRSLSYEWGRAQTGDVAVANYKRYFLRGQVLAALDRYEEAYAMFDRTLEGDPGFNPARLLRAQLLEKLGAPRDAISDYEQLLDDPELRVRAVKGLGRAKLAAGQVGASQILEVAWNADTEDRETWQMWVSACRAEGDLFQRLRAFDELDRKIGLTGEDWVDWGRALQEAGDVGGSLTKYTRAIEVNPLLANAYFNAGDLLYGIGAYIESARVYESGLRLEPHHVEAWFTLGNALAQINLDQAALVAYNQALTLDPHHVGVLHNRGLLAA